MSPCIVGGGWTEGAVKFAFRKFLPACAVCPFQGADGRPSIVIGCWDVLTDGF